MDDPKGMIIRPQKQGMLEKFFHPEKSMGNSWLQCTILEFPEEFFEER